MIDNTDYFFCNVEQTQDKVEFLKSLKEVADRIKQQVYVLSGPLTDHKYTYNDKSLMIVLSSKKKVAFVSSKDKDEDFEDTCDEIIEDIGNNITIWLGVIGAICTILPVVLGIKQSIDSQQIMNQLRKEADADKKKLEEEMSKQKKEIEAKSDEYKKKLEEEMSKHQEEMRSQSDEHKRKVEEEIGNLQKDMEDKLSKEMHLHTISYLDRLLLSVSHLCNIRDIKFKGDMPILSSPIIRPMLESIEENSKEAYKQYCDIQDKCSIDQNKVIFYAALEALNSIRNLAQIYEDVVGVETMVQLQSLKDSISVYLKQWNEKVETSANKPVLEPVDPLCEVKLAGQKIHRIIVEELKRLEKEKKEKEKKIKL